jgi:hypothetical protein
VNPPEIFMVLELKGPMTGWAWDMHSVGEKLVQEFGVKTQNVCITGKAQKVEDNLVLKYILQILKW